MSITKVEYLGMDLQIEHIPPENNLIERLLAYPGTQTADLRHTYYIRSGERVYAHFYSYEKLEGRELSNRVHKEMGDFLDEWLRLPIDKYREYRSSNG